MISSSHSVGMKKFTNRFLLFLLLQLTTHSDTYANPVYQPYLEYHMDPTGHLCSSNNANMEPIEILELKLDQPINRNNVQLRNAPSLNVLKRNGDLKNKQVFSYY